MGSIFLNIFVHYTPEWLSESFNIKKFNRRVLRTHSICPWLFEQIKGNNQKLQAKNGNHHTLCGIKRLPSSPLLYLRQFKIQPHEKTSRIKTDRIDHVIRTDCS